MRPRGSIHGACGARHPRGRSYPIRCIVRPAGGDWAGYFSVEASTRVASWFARAVFLVLDRGALFAAPERGVGALAIALVPDSGFAVSSSAVAGESMTFGKPTASRNSARRVW